MPVTGTMITTFPSIPSAGSALRPTAPLPLAPFQIGSVTIQTPLPLAPMAGQTSYPFRVLCREMGECGLVCTELRSSQAIHYRNRKTLGLFDLSGAERP